MSAGWDLGAVAADGVTLGFAVVCVRGRAVEFGARGDTGSLATLAAGSVDEFVGANALVGGSGDTLSVADSGAVGADTVSVGTE